jgi:hypothetical protein
MNLLGRNQILGQKWLLLCRLTPVIKSSIEDARRLKDVDDKGNVLWQN